MTKMEELLMLLQDGKSRSLEMIASDLHCSVEQVKRNVEFLEKTGIIKHVSLLPEKDAPCGGCNGGCHGSCEGGTCSGCMPKGGFTNMGSAWEVL